MAKHLYAVKWYEDLMFKFNRTSIDPFEPFRRKLEPTRRRYEYKCPYCGHINVRHEPCVRVVCDRCGRAFYVTISDRWRHVITYDKWRR